MADFYFPLVSDPNFKEIIEMSTYSLYDKPRCNLAETKAVIQLKDGQQPTPILDPYPPVPEAEAVANYKV